MAYCPPRETEVWHETTGAVFLETGLAREIRVFLESCNCWSVCKARDLQGVSVKGLQASDCPLYLSFDAEAGSSCPGVTADLTDLLRTFTSTKTQLKTKKRQEH